MRTTTKPPRKEKMVPFPASLDRRATLAFHALEGIPDDMLRAVASHAPGERVRALAETGVVRYADGVLTPTPDERLEQRVAALEKELANVRGLAEGAQRTAYRIGFAGTAALSRILAAWDPDMDVFNSCGPLESSIRNEEMERCLKLESEKLPFPVAYRETEEP